MLKLESRLRHAQALAANQLKALRLLEKSLPELRAEIVAEIASNPAIEDLDHPLEVQLSAAEQSHETEYREADYSEYDFTRTIPYDEETAERRQSFFDNQVGVETLQQHLTAQLPLSNLPRSDWEVAEILVGDLDDDGYYRGSLPDMAMVFGRSVRQLSGILKKITELDPLGCGAVTLRECLLAQLEKIANPRQRKLVRRIIDTQLERVGAGEYEPVAEALGITPAQLQTSLNSLRELDPRPGRNFPGEKDRVEYVNPEIHTERLKGRYVAITDERSLPRIRISSRYLEMLQDPQIAPETRKYLNERIAAAKELEAAIAKRQQTVQAIADYIYAHQQPFFEQGFAALSPMTEQEVAEAVKVHPTTVSRAVRNKYAATPQGTVQLRRFFTSAIRNAAGEEISQSAALVKLKELVAAEDPASPLTDEQLTQGMKAAGYPLARRTVVKYRERLGIPKRTERRCAR